MPKGIRWSLDELLANIDIDKFAEDYENELYTSDILEKYNISPKLLNFFLQSLLSMGKIKKIRNNDNTVTDKKKNTSLNNNNNQTRKQNKKYLDTNRQNKLYDEIDIEINDLLLGITDTKNKNLKTEDLPQTLHGPVQPDEETKKEFISLCREGVPSKFILHKLGIGIYFYNKWKNEFNVGETKIYNSPISRLNFLKNQKLLYQIEKVISTHNGVMFLNDLSEELKLSTGDLLDSIEKSNDIFTLRLSFPTFKRETQDSVKYFKKHAFDILVYLDIKAALKLLFQILNIDGTGNSLDEESYQVILDIFETRLSISSIKQLLEEYDKITDYSHPVIPLSLYDEKMKKITQSISLWEEVLSFTLLQPRPKVHRTEVFDEEQYKYLKSAIMDFLDFKGKNGATGPVIYRTIKEINPNYVPFCRKVIKNLLDENKVFMVEHSRKFPVYVIEKFYDQIVKIQNIKEYGRKIEDPVEYIEEIQKLPVGELDSSNNLTTRIAGLFIVRNYSLNYLNKNESYFNFMASSEEDRIYVKIDPYAAISNSYLLQLHEQLPPNSSLILINFSDTSTKTVEFLKTLNESLSRGHLFEIWNKEHIASLVKEKSYEPSIGGSLVKVMEGPYQGFYGIVKQTNFTSLSQSIEILGKDNIQIEIYAGFLKQLSFDSVIVQESESFIEALKIINSMCTDTEFSEGLKLNVFINPVIGKIWKDQENITEFKLTCQASHKEDYLIDINFYPKWNGFLFDDKDNYNDTPQNFCKNIVVSCNCMYYLDQQYQTIFLCRHIVASLLEKWMMTKQDKKSFLDSLKKIKFFTYDVFIVYRFFLEIAQRENINDCRLLLYMFSTKLLDYCQDLGFFTIIDSLEKKLQEKQEKQFEGPQKMIFQFGTKNEEYSIEFSFDHDNLERIINLTKKFPQFVDIFKNIVKIKYILGCLETLIEIIDVFYIKNELNYYQVEHFVIESLKDMEIDDKILIPAIQQTWTNNRKASIIQHIKTVKESINTKNKEKVDIH